MKSLARAVRHVFQSPTKRNMVYSSAEKAVRFLLGFFVLSKIVGQIPPIQYGELSYDITVFSICWTLTSVGVDAVAVRYLLLDERHWSARLWNLVIVRGASAILCALIGVGFCFLYRSSGPLQFGGAVWFFGLATLLKVFDVSRYYYESRMRVGLIALIDMSVYLTFLFLKWYLIVRQQNILGFFIVMALEPIAGAFLLSLFLPRDLVARKNDPEAAWDLSGLIKMAFPLYFGMIAMALYMRADNLLLGWISGTQELGIYSAAVRISELLYFFPTTVSGVIAPRIYRASCTEAEAKILGGRILAITILPTLFVCLVLTFGADKMVEWLYSARYAASALPLKIHVWAAPFVCFGTINSILLLKVGRQWISLQAMVLGAALNLVMNFLLIPHLGAVAAAMATTASYALASGIYYWIHPQSREFVQAQIKELGVFVVHPVREVKRLFGAA